MLQVIFELLCREALVSRTARVSVCRVCAHQLTASLIRSRNSSGDIIICYCIILIAVLLTTLFQLEGLPESRKNPAEYFILLRYVWI